VQIGDENVHRVRALLDEVFGEANYVSEICVQKTGGQETTFIPNVSDYVLWYAKDASHAKYRQLYQKKELGVGEGTGQRYDRIQLANGERCPLVAAQRNGSTDIPNDARAYQLTSLISSGIRTNTTAEWRFRGNRYHSGATSNWKTSLRGLDTLSKADRIEARKSTVAYVRFIDDFRAYPLSNIWTDVAGAAGKIYVVQTSATIIQRCILMATDPGDLVLDPTCGSGTTAYVAEQWGRRWISIDTSRVALALARARIMGARYPYYLLADSRGGQLKDAEVTRTAPSEVPTQGDIRQGFVCERIPHVTLKSIANNSEIDVIWEEFRALLDQQRERLNVAMRKEWEEWEIPREPEDLWNSETQELFYRLRAEEARGKEAIPKKLSECLRAINHDLKRDYILQTLPARPADPWPEPAQRIHAEWWRQRIERQKAIDSSIAARAEYEYLFDKPYEDPKKVRVAGPFTVESLSPHRILAVDEDDELLDSAAKPSDERDFVQMILDNLQTAGVQQAHKDGKITFSSLTLLEWATIEWAD
jgi:adenine-specific DNA-methyltransferase